MRIISWNVNGFRNVAKKRALEQLVIDYEPDLLFIQEVKCSEEDAKNATASYARTANNEYVWFFDESKIAGRHGVALLARDSTMYSEDFEDMIVWFDNIDPLVEGQEESRLQKFVINGIMIINTYSVNVRQDLSRVEARAIYDNHIYKLVEEWYAQGNEHVIILGDFNVVSEAEDYHGNVIKPTLAGMTDSERTSFKVLLKGCNLVDTYRQFNPNERDYSYWSYRGYARESNKGWRLDYALVSQSVLPFVEDAYILTDFEGSDHAPIVLELR